MLCMMHPLRSKTDLHHIMHHPSTTTTSSFMSLPTFINQLNDTATTVGGNEICGLLYKWVNYARGWRPRWFILHDGILSYFNREIVHSASKVIGFRRTTHSDSTLIHRKPLGQVHLMVCSVREHKSNKKRFCVYTGMKKRLHLRAETKEDRDTWVEAMLAVKDVFPRSSNSIAESISEAESVVISTHRLRQRLLEEGVREATIQESENIMRSEISHVLSHNHFNLNLIDTTERVDQVQSQRQQYLKDDGESFISMLENDSEGSASDSTHENNHDAFFDTCDILSTCSGRSNGSQQYQRSCIDFECGESSTNGEYEGKSFDGSNYPHVRRRKKLPDPVEKEKAVGLWSIIKDNIGKDLTNICLPVYFNEPISSLQKCFEDLEYSFLLDQAYACGKMGNSLMRMLHVAAFAVSGYACTDKRSCKPFNPLLGETYEADYPDKGIRFISEKVSHHPVILACHCEGKGWKFWGDSNLKNKFWGRSIQVDPVGVLTLEFDDGEIFRWSKVSTAIYNLILGKIYCDHYGTMRIEGNREYSCKIKFKEQSIIDKNPHQVHGVVEDKKGKVVASLCGNWDESLHYTIIENSGKGKRSNVSSKARQLWKRSEPSDYPTRYNLTQFAITLNEITPMLREKLPPTDSRLRPDQRCLENGEYEKANAEKLHLEQRQRQARKLQEKGWKPRWFAMDEDSHTYCYVGGYWEAREKGNWESCSDIFGQLPTDNDTDFDPTN